MWDKGYSDLYFVINNSRFDNEPTDAQRSVAYAGRGICAVALGNISQAVIDLKFAKEYDSGNKLCNDLAKFLGINSVEGTISCLANCDWIYPKSNPFAAWKFNSDGTFNYSTTTFGGMSAWGNWEVSEPGIIKVSYTRTTLGVSPSLQTLKMNSCESLEAGSTIYFKK